MASDHVPITLTTIELALLRKLSETGSISKPNAVQRAAAASLQAKGLVSVHSRQIRIEQPGVDELRDRQA